MSYIPLEKLINRDKADTSIYKFVLAAALRGNELAQGAQPLVKHDSHNKVSTVALMEFAQGKVRYEETKPKGKKASS